MSFRVGRCTVSSEHQYWAIQESFMEEVELEGRVLKKQEHGIVSVKKRDSSLGHVVLGKKLNCSGTHFPHLPSGHND